MTNREIWETVKFAAVLILLIGSAPLIEFIAEMLGV